MLDLSVKFRDYSFIGCKEIRNKRSSLTLAGLCSHCACALSRDLRIGGQKRPPIWNPRPQFIYLLYNFYGATVTIKGSLLSRAPIVSDFRSKIFLVCFFAKNRRLGALNRGLNATFNFCNPKKAHPCVISRLLNHHASKSVEGSDLWVVPRKKGICTYVKII